MIRQAYRRHFTSRAGLMIWLLVLFALAEIPAASQKLKGKILDQSGQPVGYATVYVDEIKLGTTSNARGDYELRLPPGNYIVLFQSLGYEPVIESINIGEIDVEKNAVLPEQIYEIQEVRISPSGEDPALSIMRKVIGLTPYYLNYIDHYKAEVYIKGNLYLRKIPKLIQKSMRMGSTGESSYISAGGKATEDEDILKEGDSFFLESYNEIEFTAPDKYVQRVISLNSTFPDQSNGISPMEYIQASFYQPVIAELAISPLSPQAFSYYKFRYIGTTFQGNNTINKIEVIPRQKSQQLFSGTIFIIEDLWCLHSVDLTNENIAGKIRVRELYIPVREDVWMPVSHQFDIDLQIIGIRADVGYTSSVKYIDVLPNEKLQKPGDLATGFAGRYQPDSVVTKSGSEINRILRKEELTNRDMVKLGRLLDKESKNTRPDSVVKNLEIKDNTTHIIEPDAARKDSAYWAEIRPIPLSEIELKSVRKSDSIKTAASGIRKTAADTSSSQGDRKRASGFRTAINRVMSGHTWSDTSGLRFTYGGLMNLKSLSFNTVDGFIYGLDFRINKQLKHSRSISLYPDFRWAFSREKLMWGVNANYSVQGMNPSQFYLRTGSSSNDMAKGGGINPLINSITSLLMERNYMKLYDSRYLTLGYEKEIINGLKLNFEGGYEERRLLENTTSFSVFDTKREYSPNLPVNEYLDPENGIGSYLSDQKHFEFVTNVTFTPYQKYRVYKGNKSPEGSDWPTFMFTWKHGANLSVPYSGKYSHFDMFRFEVSQQRETGPFSEFRWRIRTGGVANNRDLPWFDFFHFNSQPVRVLINNYDDAFMLPAYYSLSTPEFFGEAHIKYTTPYLLLKLLPGLSTTLIRENLIFSYLGTQNRGHYTEIGYSLSEIFFIGEAGIFAGFDNLNYNSFGVKLTLKID